MNLLDTNAVDIDQSPFKPFDYNETEGGVDDHGCADDSAEIEAEAFENSQAKTGKSQRSKNYTILEDQALIKAWSAVSLDACKGTSQTAKRYNTSALWQSIPIGLTHISVASRALGEYQANVQPLGSLLGTSTQCTSKWNHGI